MKIQKGLSIILLLFFGLFTQPHPAAAVPCNFHALMTESTKNISNFTSTCTITGVEGVDNPQNSETSTTSNASITLGTNSAITINNGGTLVANSLIITGSIAIQTGGQIKLNAPLYVADADADGYPVDFTLYTASASGLRRLGLMRNFTTVDCGDSTYSTTNVCCTANGGACGSDGTCCSAVCGTNADADNYFSSALGHTGTCQASALAYADCYDANASAYPGSGACSGSHRGDGSYDYNCVSGSTACGTTYYSYGSFTPDRKNKYGECVGGIDTYTKVYDPIGCGVYGATVGTYHESLNSCDYGFNEAGSLGTQACQ